MKLTNVIFKILGKKQSNELQGKKSKTKAAITRAERLEKTVGKGNYTRFRGTEQHEKCFDSFSRKVLRNQLRKKYGNKNLSYRWYELRQTVLNSRQCRRG